VIAFLAVACTTAAQSWTPLDVHVGGRTVTNPGDAARHTYSWPGVYFEARFAGPTVRVDVDDDQNTLHVLVDGELMIVLPRAGRRSLVLRDLGDGEHAVRVETISETQGPTGAFLGFFVPDAASARPRPEYSDLIEFIGDSNMVGYGNTSPGRECTTEEIRDTTNTSLAFSPNVAKHFNADYRMIASSGFGMVRNYANKEPGLTMPVLYDYALHDPDGPTWTAGDPADVIVIRLGSNDFSTPIGDDEAWAHPDALHADFRQTYTAFVERLQREQGPARFVLIVDPELEADLQSVRAGLEERGIGHVTVLVLPKLERSACDYHFSINDHAKVASLLIDLLSGIAPLAGQHTGMTSQNR
jgi:hypothetical protein